MTRLSTFGYCLSNKNRDRQTDGNGDLFLRSRKLTIKARPKFKKYVLFNSLEKPFRRPYLETIKNFFITDIC